MLKRKVVTTAPAAATPTAQNVSTTPTTQSPHSTTGTPSTETSSTSQIKSAPNTTPSSISNLNLVKGSYNATRAQFHKQTQVKGYYSVRAESKSSLTVYDQFGRAQACPNCCTSRITQPSLQLLYATCCGKVLCVTCRDNLCISPLTCDTTGCIGILDRSTWDSKPVDEYRYALERQKRIELGKMAKLEEIDFDPATDKLTFHHYNEDLQLLLYDYTYGNPPLVADLGATRSGLERKYAIQIQRHEQAEQQRKAEEQHRFLEQQLNHQSDLHLDQNGTMTMAMVMNNTQMEQQQGNAPHRDVLERWFYHYRITAEQFPLELHSDESWEQDWLVPRRCDMDQGFTSVPPPPISAEAMSNPNTNDNSTTMGDIDTTDQTNNTPNENDKNTDLLENCEIVFNDPTHLYTVATTHTSSTILDDQQKYQQPYKIHSIKPPTTTTNPFLRPNPSQQSSTTALTKSTRTAFDRLKHLREQELVQRKDEETREKLVLCANASGFMDYSTQPMTQQYRNVLDALQYENYHGVGVEFDTSFANESSGDGWTR